MGIYLDMEMPKSCFNCPFMYGRKYCMANSKIEFNDPEYSELKGRHEGCPLVPVPPHGRLIDADKLSSQCDDPYWCVWLSDIDNAPTLIPADNGPHGCPIYNRGDN